MKLCSVQCLVSLLSAYISYFVFTRLVCFSIFFIAVFLFCIFLFCIGCFLFCFVYWLPPSYFCTSLPTAATGWEPSCSKYISHRFLLQKNTFYAFMFLLSIPIPTQETRLKKRHFVLYIYIPYKHGERNSKFQFSFQLALVL